MRERKGPVGFGQTHSESWRDHLIGARPWHIVLLGALVIGVVVLLAVLRPPPPPVVYQPSERQQAWDACVGFVAADLGLPAADAEPFANGAVTLLGAGRYEVAVRYGAARDVRHKCEVALGEGGAWARVWVR